MTKYVLGRGPGRGRPRTRTSRIRSRTGTRTSEDHDFREFLDEDGQDEDQDGDEDVRGREISRLFRTRTARTRTGTKTSEDVNFRKFARTRTARTSTSCGGLFETFFEHFFPQPRFQIIFVILLVVAVATTEPALSRTSPLFLIEDQLLNSRDIRDSGNWQNQLSKLKILSTKGVFENG